MKDEKESMPFPDEEWFNERELDEVLKTFEYEMNGEKRKVTFRIQSLSQEEMAIISANCTEQNELGLEIPDSNKLGDEVLLKTISFDVDGLRQQLTPTQLSKLKFNKKNGLYQKILNAALDLSGAIAKKEIEEQKNSESPAT